MATMLAVLTTDAAVDGAELRDALERAVDHSFNALSVDGCTSTNDTVIVLASGRAGKVAPSAFRAALAEACADLASQMAGDAEGATKVVRMQVTGASSEAEARTAARKVAESQLVKCSWYGQDAYWGRILSELGSAGVAFDPDLASVAYGGIEVCAGGIATTHDEDAVSAHGRTPLEGERRSRPRGWLVHHSHQRPHPRVHRREHGHVVRVGDMSGAARRRLSSPKPFPTFAASGARRSS